eukprot:FR735245.1.p1 GENE.FR735245.1~~FR735245.1.p1  ORF type:complete len:271 (+),score=28.50 FR735245.1:102-914(+)
MESEADDLFKQAGHEPLLLAEQDRAMDKDLTLEPAPPTLAQTLALSAVALVVSGPGGYTDRKTSQCGAVALKNPTQLGLVMNAEVMDLRCLSKAVLCICCCAQFDLKRSYLYIRENSLEQNCAAKQMCCGKTDNISVQYFDRPPFKSYPLNNCFRGAPEVHVIESGCMCCCQKVLLPKGPCCVSKVYVIATPQQGFPCCCFSYKVGPVPQLVRASAAVSPGNPRTYLLPQLPPKGTEKFVEGLTSVLSTFGARRRSGHPPKKGPLDDSPP